MNKTTTIIIFLLVVLSSLVSVFFLFQQSIRLDEAQSIWFFSKSVIELLKLSSQDVNLPLYGIILHFWMQIFGTNIVLVRTPSLIFFWLTIIPLYKLARESSNKQTALLTVAIFCFSPFIDWYSSEARTYTLFTLITTLNSLYFLRLVKSNDFKNKLGYFLSTLVGVYTHYFFVFLLACQFIYLLILWIEGKKKPGATKSFVGLNIFTLLFFAPWLIYVYKEGVAAYTQPLIFRPTSYNIVQVLVNFTTGFQSQVIQSAMVSLWPLMTIILFFVFTYGKKRMLKNGEYFFLVSFLPILMVFLISFIKPIFLSRYLILVTPTLFFLMAWIVLNNFKRVAYGLSSIILLGMLGLSIFQSISSKTTVKENYEGVTKYLNNYITANDIVAITTPFTIYPIEYQYNGTAKLDTIPQWNKYIVGPIPGFSMNNLVNQINIYKKNYNRLYLVASYDQGYEQQIINYLDTHYALMGTGDFSNDLQIRIYKLRY